MKNVITQTNKFGRWGFHSVDYTTYMKLKTLYKIYWKCLRLRAAHQRWENKFPKNRKGTEPRYGTVHKMIIDSNIFQEFHNARTPIADPDFVPPRKMTDMQIDNLLMRWAVFQEKRSDLAA
jgi:hypothetical protein